MLRAILWLLSWFVPPAVVNLFRNLRAMGAEPSPDMQAFVDMAAAALQSKNAYIYDQSQRLDAAEARAREGAQGLGEAQQQITQLELRLKGVESKLEEQREATLTALLEAQQAQQRAGELQQALITAQADKEEVRRGAGGPGLNAILTDRPCARGALAWGREVHASAPCWRCRAIPWGHRSDRPGRRHSVQPRSSPGWTRGHSNPPHVRS